MGFDQQEQRPERSRSRWNLGESVAGKDSPRGRREPHPASEDTL